MSPGREMNAEIATRIMGLPESEWDPPCLWHHSTDDAEKDTEIGWTGWCYDCNKAVSEVAVEPHWYSTEKDAAIDALEHHGKAWSIHSNASGTWFTVEIYDDDMIPVFKDGPATTLAHAACLALLRSVGAA